MIEKLKQDVYNTAMLLPQYKLTKLNWGSVSAIDRENKTIALKPSGLFYDRLTPDDIVTMDLNGQTAGGKDISNTDALTHLELYREFPSISGIVHSQSRWATIFSQLGTGIPALGTIHADYFHGEIPCTRKLRTYEIRGDYAKEVGAVIIERFFKGKLDYEEIPAVLVCNHGPYTWGTSLEDALQNAIVLEEVAYMAWHCMALPDKFLVPMQKDLLDRHYNHTHPQHQSNNEIPEK